MARGDKREPNFLKAWRERRGLTRAELADASATTGAVIALLEEGDRGLSEKWRLRFSPLLDVRPGDLMTSDPNRG
jgi:transcriptional regulator with XRE-family HTH domain